MLGAWFSPKCRIGIKINKCWIINRHKLWTGAPFSCAVCLVTAWFSLQCQSQKKTENKLSDFKCFEALDKGWHQTRLKAVHPKRRSIVDLCGQYYPSVRVSLAFQFVFGCKMEIRGAQGEMPGGVLFLLLWSGCNPSVSEKWKVSAVHKVLHTSLWPPTEQRVWGSRG